MLGSRLGDRHQSAYLAGGRSGPQPGGSQGNGHAAKTLAATGLNLFASEDLRRQARAEWREKTGGRTYVCPIPPHVPAESGLRMTDH